MVWDLMGKAFLAVRERGQMMSIYACAGKPLRNIEEMIGKAAAAIMWGTLGWQISECQKGNRWGEDADPSHK